MLHKTRGIVLHHVKYSETSVVAYIYTEAFGRQTYIINGIRSRKSKNRMVLLQPLTLLNMQVYYRPKNTLQRISELNVAVPFNTVFDHPVKSCIVLFLAEILYRSLKQEDPDPALLEYLFNALQYFDIADDQHNTANFHLIFLFYLSRHLGFFPQNNYDETNQLFDLINGKFVMLPPIHKEYLSVDESEIFKLFFDTQNDFTFNANIKINKLLRTKMLDILLRYYSAHIEGLRTIKSLQVLKEVFS